MGGLPANDSDRRRSPARVPPGPGSVVRRSGTPRLSWHFASCCTPEVSATASTPRPCPGYAGERICSSREHGWLCSSTAASGIDAPSTAPCRGATLIGGAPSSIGTSSVTVRRIVFLLIPAGRFCAAGNTNRREKSPTESRMPGLDVDADPREVLASRSTSKPSCLISNRGAARPRTAAADAATRIARRVDRSAAASPAPAYSLN